MAQMRKGKFYKRPKKKDYPAYGVIDPEYARIYTQARNIAHQYGYACIMHGSFTRDLDLLMVPWTEDARGNCEQIMRLIADSCDLHFRTGMDPYTAPVDWTYKPHGRKACTLYFKKFGDPRYLDIGFMPSYSGSRAGDKEYASWNFTALARACTHPEGCTSCNWCGFKAVNEQATLTQEQTNVAREPVANHPLSEGVSPDQGNGRGADGSEQAGLQPHVDGERSEG